MAVPPPCLTADCAAFFENDDLADLTIVVQGEDATREFKAHRAIVGARCPGMRGMLTANMAEANSGTITLAETEPAAFKEFLRYLYTDAVPTAALEAMGDHLLDLGTKYGVARLVALCENALASSLSVANVADRLMLGNLHDVPRLKALCMDFFGRNSVAVMATAGFKRLCQHPRCGQLLGEVLAVHTESSTNKRKRDDGAGAGAGGSGEPSVADIRGMRLAELKAELSKRGLSTAGRKRELARRLEDAAAVGER